MNFRLAMLAALATAALAGQAWADPEIMVKCDSARPVGQRFGNPGGWQPYEPTDRAVTITRDKGKWRARKWEQIPATIAAGKATAKIPADAAAFYLNLFDDRNCAVSTRHVVRAE